jgi:very-short-patch-repair endonuclease
VLSLLLTGILQGTHRIETGNPKKNETDYKILEKEKKSKKKKIRRDHYKHQRFLSLPIHEKAKFLNENLAKSEKWFHTLWERHDMKHEDDQFNHPFIGLIPDCINHKFKYVIEIDGSIHIKKHVKEWDNHRDRKFLREGYQVFHVEAYKYDQFVALCEVIERLRMTPINPKPRIAIEKKLNSVILKKYGCRPSELERGKNENL